ncbi:hypothetical protein N0V82_009487 [Gnomoniopsis sp. IMI 355080]|nr:hypothetical protein N0V82_009487 [Gnomoniopsis sp. IMI 355080]
MSEPTEPQDSPAHSMTAASKSSPPAGWKCFHGPLMYATARINIERYISSQPIVTISVRGGGKFHVHKSILTQNSAYFDRALNGPFMEANTQSIDLDHVSHEAFGQYVNILYQAAYTEDFTLCDVFTRPHRQMIFTNLGLLLPLWRLADYFVDPKMKALVEDGMNFCFSLLTVSGWEDSYERPGSAARFTARFKSLQTAFTDCKENNIPYQDKLVTALANCPPQVFAENVEELSDEEFKKAVIKAFALRFVGIEASNKVTKAKKDHRVHESNRKSHKRKLDQD